MAAPVGRTTTVLTSTPAGWRTAHTIDAASSSQLRISPSGGPPTGTQNSEATRPGETSVTPIPSERAHHARIFRKPRDCPLGGAIDVRGDAEVTSDAADEDDPAASFPEVRQREADQQAGAKHVGEHHLPPDDRVTVCEAVVASEPGVGDGGVQASEGFHRVLDGGRHRVGIGGVRSDCRHLAWPTETVGEPVEPVTVGARSRRLASRDRAVDER